MAKGFGINSDSLPFAQALGEPLPKPKWEVGRLLTSQAIRTCTPSSLALSSALQLHSRKRVARGAKSLLRPACRSPGARRRRHGPCRAWPCEAELTPVGGRLGEQSKCEPEHPMPRRSTGGTCRRQRSGCRCKTPWDNCRPGFVCEATEILSSGAPGRLCQHKCQRKRG